MVKESRDNFEKKGGGEEVINLGLIYGRDVNLC